MIQLDFPNGETLRLSHLVLDFNGTIAMGGRVPEGVGSRLCLLQERGIQTHLITADTHGSAKEQCAKLPLTLHIREGQGVGFAKKTLVEQLGKEQVVAIGNGRNDLLMLQTSALSIAIVGGEGCFSATALAADILVTNILDALDLLLHPNRLLATLRD